MQTCWSQALNDPDFAKHVLLLYVDVIPDLAAGAAEIFGELEHCRGVLVLDLFLDEGDHISREFGLLVRLGFFVYDGHYRMDVPERITLAAVKQAALDVSSTADDKEYGVEMIQPERLLHTLPKTEADAQRSTVMAMRRFRAITGCRSRSVG